MRLPIVNDVVRHNPPKVRKRRMALKAGMFTTGRSSVHLFRERERLFDSGRGGRGHMNPPDVSVALESWLRRQAKADITKRLCVRGKEMRQQPGRVYIMGQRTKWGGCSRHRNLSFNWRLVMAAPE